MTDPRDPASPGDGGHAVPAELSDEQVARLLADAGPAPMPDDVGLRLDVALADLADLADLAGSADRSTLSDGQPADTTVVPLRRQHRWGPRLLVAAAVLGVVGLGFGVADGVIGPITGSDSGSDSESAADTSAAGSAGGDQTDGRKAGGNSKAGDRDAHGSVAGPKEDMSAQEAREPAADNLAALRARRLAVRDGSDLRRAVRSMAVSANAFGDLRTTRKADATSLAVSCAQPRVPGSAVTVVRYRGEFATLAVRRLSSPDTGAVGEPQGYRAEGRVYSCSLGLLLTGVSVLVPEE